MDASTFLVELRRKLSQDNEKIVNHRFVKEAEGRSLNIGRIKLFTTQQYYIISSDFRALATMLSRSRVKEEADFFNTLLAGDLEAFNQLMKLASELGLGEGEMANSRILPKAVAYTHYLAWLANFANPGEQATALIVNLPVWGSTCGRLGAALKNRYGIKSIGFFELFLTPYDSLEKAAIGVMQRYLDAHSSTMERCARLIQGYELMFWDSVYEED